MHEDVSSYLADNLRELRDARGLSQLQAAKLAEIPRATWANLESGGANPTLQVMMRIAGALHVSLEELIRAPRAGCVLYPAGSLPTRKRGGALIRDLLPDTIVGIHIERLELASHASLTGVPHRVGTREYLVCDSGRIELVAGGESFALAPGDVLAFRGDQRHSYRNPRAAKAVAYSVIAAAPV